MSDRLEEFDFLKPGEDKIIRKEAENILSSYSQVYDVLAESIQNAVDAVDERYESESQEAVCKVEVEINVPKRKITVTDTGVGMSWEVLRSSPAPNVTFKRDEDKSPERRSRGEKGVGLSFLTFACNEMKVVTCNGRNTIKARVSDAHKWVSGNVEDRPKITPVTNSADPPSEKLGSKKYTTIEMKDVHTEDYSDRDIFSLSLPELKYIIRTNTAAGHTSPVVLNREPEPKIDVELKYIDAKGNTISERIDYKLLSPEEFLTDGSILPFSRFLELQRKEELAKAKGKALVYRDIKKTPGGRDINCYVFAMAREGFDNIKEDMEIEQGWSPDDWPGIYIATRGMPTGINVEHPPTYSSGYWRRIFMVLQDDEMNFDVGRKYLQGRAAPMMKDIALDVWKDVNSFLKNLTPSDSQVVKRNKENKILKLMEQARGWGDINLDDINYQKVPQREQMVVGLFYELSGAGLMQGYKTLRNNDIDQYDSFVHYEIEKSKIGMNEAVDVEGNILEDWIIIEFKYDADSILNDILNEKKHYQDINLLVCWTLDADKFEEESISVQRIQQEDVYYYGSTHRLWFPGIYQAGETLDVIELSTFIEEI